MLDIKITYCYSKCLAGALHNDKKGKGSMKTVIKKYGWLLLVVCFVFAGVFGYSAKAQAASQYRIRINKQQNCVTIYKINKKGKYEAYKAMACSVGSATPIGSFSVKDKMRWHTLDGPVYGQYCSRITGHILFHSVWYYKEQNPSTLSNTQYNKLGSTASHGCVRLCVRDARWIYNNCSMGTPIEIYNSKNPGDLGKPDAIKLPGGWGWDPTDDTNPANPYNKRKPVIVLKKGKTGNTVLSYASKFDIFDSITAKNTTGFNSVDKVSYTVKYKAVDSKKFKKTKQLNTFKSGTYKVAFQLKDEIDRVGKLTVNYVVGRKIPLTSVELNKTSHILHIGGTSDETICKIKLKSYKPSKASITDLRFTSSNTAVATVSDKGVITAVSPGYTRIKAKAKDGSKVKAYCRIYVKKYATGVTLTASQTSIKTNETTTLGTALVPADATGKNDLSYTYTSSNPAVAVVDANGTVRGVTAGTATITVTASNAAVGGAALTSQVAITVTDPNNKSDDVTSSALGVN